MKKVIQLFLLLCPTIIFAQDIAPENIVPYKKERKNYRYIGLQSNMLFKQFLNLNNSSSSIASNPFLLTYSSNNKVTGKGIALGIGLDVANDASNDGVTSIRTNNVNFSGRFGYERKYHQDKKWVYSYATELMAIVLVNNTTTTVSSISPTTTETNILKVLTGINLRGTLAYKLGEHVFIGTEANLNFLLGISQSNVSSGVFNRQSENPLPIDIGIKIPTAIYLIVRI